MRLIIIGAGGYGRTVADVAVQTGLYHQILFLDDRRTDPDVVGICENFRQFCDSNTAFYPAFGNNQVRLNWINRLKETGCCLATIIHPAAYVSPTAKIMPGTVILPKAVVGTDCVVMSGCIVNYGAIVDHGCVIEEGVHVCLGAIVKAENRIPACMKVEAGEVIENSTYVI